MPREDEILAALQRVEEKLDMLLTAMAEEEQESPLEAVTLDGEAAGRARNPGEPL